eukprot:Rmarinus@m.19624
MEKLVEAIENGSHRRIKLLLRESLDVDTPIDPSNMTCLHLASFLGDKETVKMLLRKGATALARDENGNTPAHLAAAQGHVKLVDYFVRKGLVSLHERNAAGISLRRLCKELLDTASHKKAQVEKAKDILETELRLKTAREKLRLYTEAEELASKEGWARKVRDHMQGDKPISSWSQSDTEFYHSYQSTKDGTPREAEFWKHVLEEKTYQDRKRKRPHPCDDPSRFLSQLGRRVKFRKESSFAPDLKAYDLRWRDFEVKAGEPRSDSKPAAISFSDVPWPTYDLSPPSPTGSSPDLTFFTEQTCTRFFTQMLQPLGQEEYRKRVRDELRRWHADKFETRFLGSVLEEDREYVARHARIVAVSLSSLLATAKPVR